MNQQASLEGSNHHVITEQQRANEALFLETAEEVRKHLGETAAFLYRAELAHNGLYQDRVSFGPTGEAGQNPVAELSGAPVLEQYRYPLPGETRSTVAPVQHEQAIQAPRPNNVINMQPYRARRRPEQSAVFPEGPEIIPYTPRKRRQHKLARFVMGFSRRGRGQRVA